MAGRVFRALTGAAGTVASFGNSTRISPRCFGRGTVNTARPFTTGFGVRVAQGACGTGQHDANPRPFFLASLLGIARGSKSCARRGPRSEDLLLAAE